MTQQAEKPTVAKRKARKSDTPLTQEEYNAQMKELMARAEAAGLDPMPTMASATVSHGLVQVRNWVDGFLTSLENGRAATKKKS